MSERVYRGITLTIDDIARYYYVMKTPGSFGDPLAEGLNSILLVYEFPNKCQTAIDLNRISDSLPCISEFLDEKELLILPYTVFEVSNVTEETDSQSVSIYLRNILGKRYTDLVDKSNLFIFIRTTALALQVFKSLCKFEFSVVFSYSQCLFDRTNLHNKIFNVEW
ncbi:unnamed protein product [Didymodactylos carnosus]|uniref:Uncharacterized protein n=1 Tax=Didymodactylos carnosus TaxID=1234261 RepID=A0A815S917_9BILA|nr:unnamed protein product [Didymodactylos carnosus]CAF1488831.1 unnamed protein product [Didymodactylos carnosus]CAF3733473.1 unnamed protein product [Didymodactylos carnosus]CAF4352236.1 unnamed protein product [Didymodactylos carnosus]